LIEIPLVGAEQVAEKPLSLRRFIVSLAILALTISLANRTFQGSFDSRATVHSVSVNSKVQHRDKDASELVAPVATFSLLYVTEPSIVSARVQRVFLDFDHDCLYNRPPPPG